ncbi:BLUF domain-containing protein [Paracoccus aerius]|nr:BLUF domain-containing protein [Paracoccus aerius]
MIAILYRSEALTAAHGEADAEIVSVARERNTVLNVTGFLHRENDTFYQWLEGPADAVRRIFASVLKDRRHRNVQKLSEIKIDHRSFPAWSMTYSDGRTTSLFDWAAEAELSLRMARSDQVSSVLQFHSQKCHDNSI